MPANNIVSSWPLKPEKVFKFSPINDVISEVLTEVGFMPDRMQARTRRAYARVLHTLLANLYDHHKADSARWTIVPRGSRSYEVGTDYHSAHLSRRIIVSILDQLLRNELIEQMPGFLDRVTGRSFYTRVRPTQALIELLQARIGDASIGNNVQAPLVIVRDDEGQSIDYSRNAEVRRCEAMLTDYNDLLERTDLTVDLGNDAEWQRILLSQRVVRRIYRRSLQEGGRFYGGFWQGMKKRFRANIRIDGEAVRELDISAFHPRLLYLKEGVEIGSANIDPYRFQIEEEIVINPAKYRKLCKVILLTALNSRSETATLQALRWELKHCEWRERDTGDASKLPYYHEVGLYLPQLLAACIQHNHVIQRYINCGEGIRLQNLDSHLCSKVIESLTRMNIPVLTLHDSFIVRESDVATLKLCVNSGWNDLKRAHPEFESLTILPLV